MNTAYHAHLDKALDKWDAPDTDKATIRRFLTWLDGTPDADDPEPDLYEYGDAAGTYPIGYCDDGLLTQIAPGAARLDPATRATLLSAWRDVIHDSLLDDSTDRDHAADIAEAADNTGIDPATIGL